MQMEDEPDDADAGYYEEDDDYDNIDGVNAFNITSILPEDDIVSKEESVDSLVCLGQAKNHDGAKPTCTTLSEDMDLSRSLF